MRTIRRILAAVRNPTARSLPAVAKAGQLARALGAELELFHAIDESIQVTTLGLAEDGLQRFEDAQSARCMQQLERIAARVRRGGLKVTTATEWDYPSYEAILRRAHRIKADLVVAECHAGRHIAPALLRLADWELLRLSTLPVLLVKRSRPYRRPVVLAAVDPTHAFSKPAKLDEEILRMSAAVSEALHGTVHAAHAYVAIPFAGVTAGVPSARVIAQIAAQAAAQAKIDLARVVRPANIPPARRHLVGRHPIDAIQDVARKIHSEIVVMGAISRSGLKRLFIGNTAERLLDALPCDLLIVKPAKFTDQVPRAIRGPRLIITPLVP